MMDWLRRLIRRRPDGHAEPPAVKEAKQEQAARFSEWETVMKEVNQVQRIAKGSRPPRPHSR